MHLALMKGPLFYKTPNFPLLQKKHFPFFYKKTPPIFHFYKKHAHFLPTA